MMLRVAASRKALGRHAAREIGESLRTILQTQEHVRMILAAAPSQSEMLAALRSQGDIEWQRITAFHMDEYIGLTNDAPQLFANWLKREFVNHVPLLRFESIQPGINPEGECQRYAEMLAEAPIDLVLLGIGTNGHLAFNDPPADLHDFLAARVVTLDAMCRHQQVQDGCFAKLDDVPLRAVTLTIPTLLGGRELFCCVPGSLKKEAVRATLEAPISGECPSTALRTHPRCTLYLDRESSSLSSIA